MTEFYAIATNKDGVNFRINNLPEQRISAVNSATTHCRKNNLELQGVYPVKGSQRQNGTLSKTIKSKRGRKLDWNY